MLFCGDGTLNNPYLIATALDFTAISQNSVEQNTYYKLYKNLTVSTDYDAQSGKVFDGILDGDGRTVTIDNGNAGLLAEVGEHGRVTTVNIAGSVSALKDSVGALANVNRGRVEKINVTANVTSTAGTVGTNGLDDLLTKGKGIAGGVVGTNETTGVVYNCKIVTQSSSDGVVKASIGGGCIVGFNKGTVESCVSEGAFGAWNSTESGGKTLSAYSYAGGVVGINAGTVKECSLTGSGKMLAQRYTDASAVIEGTNHIALGGIVGYNMEGAIVEKCEYSGIRVHGDEAIGGIVGINDGTVKNCMSEGVFKGDTGESYVGGRTDVGGIAGRMEANGIVENCINTANVFCYTEGTAYSIASKSNNSVYISVNSNRNSLAANPEAVTLTAPQGTGNVNVEETFDGKTDVKLAEKYLATVNAESAFAFDSAANTIKIVTTQIPELSLTVTVHADGKTEEQTVYETPSTISAPSKFGYVFKGWSLAEDGEIVFAKGMQISYYDLKDLRGEGGKVDLYAKYEQRTIDNNVLNVSIWNNSKGAWITETQIDKIKTDFAAYLTEKGIDVADKEIYWIVEKDVSSVANLGASVNAAENIDIVVACGTNITSTGKVEVLTRKEIVSEDYASSGRLAALLTENELAMHLFSMLTGAENGKAEVTLVGDTTVTETLDGIFANAATAPAVTPADGFKFIGWATTQDATEAQVTGTINYTAVKDYLEQGKVTLYPVFEKLPETDDNSLVVVFYAKFFDEDKVEPLKAAFQTYCTENGIEAGPLTFLCEVTGNNAAFNTYLVGLESGFDVAVGGKATSKAPIECFEQKADEINITYVYGMNAASERPAVFMNTRDIVTAFKAFLQTESASAVLNPAQTAQI
ncbi:MAG: InlB B-repeat-containing protein [Corallococcus sp.]|nr:InlB B-repeat-containing protein [Corallococcus sp.]